MLYTNWSLEPITAIRKTYSCPLTKPVCRYLAVVVGTDFHWLSAVNGAGVITVRPGSSQTALVHSLVVRPREFYTSLHLYFVYVCPHAAYELQYGYLLHHFHQLQMEAPV